MATSTAQLKPAAEPAGDKPAKSRKKRIIMLAPVLLLLLAGGGYLAFAGGSSGPPPPPKPGAVLVLEPTTINLDGGHYLKLTLALQATASAGAELDGSKALDLAIAEFGGRAVAELSVPGTRTKLKEELVKKIEKAYEEEIMDIYFREFVMQ
ncbi:MAG: flagellar basal body-associated FliL family protein [Actinobacteria bacterium]|nr:flagellar basal body-associated FliL family protein [Actinomycetota bacterium]